MARVLRSNRLGLVAMAALALLVLVLVIFWVRGCGDQAQQQPSQPADTTAQAGQTGQADQGPSVIAPPEPGPQAPPEPEPPKPSHAKTIYEQWFEAGREAFDRGEYVNARYQLSKALKGIGNPAKTNAQLQLATIAKKLTFARQIFPGDTTAESYHVKQGETPASVAKQYGITADLFMKINNIRNARSMIAGDNYKLIKGPFHVVVHKKSFELHVFLGDYFVKRYSIGLGRDNSTPVGEFLAGSRLEKPPWTGEDPKTGRKTVVYHGDPNYPLGDYWISLRDPDGDSEDTDYGIHGTNEPQTIGTLASRGCIRMHDEDIAELFDLLVTGKSRITLLAD